MKRVLSIDGGGIRGIIPAYQLVQIERELGIPIYDYFDLVVGTSTGAILAGGLGLGYSAQELLDLYVKEGSDIFNKTFKQKIKSGFGLLGAKYPNSNLEDVLFTYYGDMTLSNLNMDFLSVTFNMTDDRPRFFSKFQEPDQKLVDVVMASSAAPTYFDPKLIDGKYYADGGLVSNNPAMCALTEANFLYKAGARDISILSLGTGTRVDSYNNMDNWSLLKWINPLVEIMMGADSGVVHHQLTKLYKSLGKGSQYCRVTGNLPVGLSSQMDDAGVKNISKLIQCAEVMYHKNSGKISNFIKYSS